MHVIFILIIFNFLSQYTGYLYLKVKPVGLLMISGGEYHAQQTSSKAAKPGWLVSSNSILVLGKLTFRKIADQYFRFLHEKVSKIRPSPAEIDYFSSLGCFAIFFSFSAQLFVHDTYVSFSNHLVAICGG